MPAKGTELDDPSVDYWYIDVEAIESGANEARAIRGRTNISVVTFPNGAHFVEPRDVELRAKVEAPRHGFRGCPRQS